MAVNVVTSNMADQVAHWASEASAIDVASGINTIVAVQYPIAGAGMHHVVEGVAWSYSGDPTGGNLTITDGVTITFDIDITNQGYGYVPVRKRGTANTIMNIALAAGGAGVVGRLNIIGHRLD